jgi:hypothetical protein
LPGPNDYSDLAFETHGSTPCNRCSRMPLWCLPCKSARASRLLAYRILYPRCARVAGREAWEPEPGRPGTRRRQTDPVAELDFDRRQAQVHDAPRRFAELCSCLTQPINWASRTSRRLRYGPVRQGQFEALSNQSRLQPTSDSFFRGARG